MISVIIPVFNTVDYIDKCVESVVAQTYHDLEILLIDDCSTDGTSKKLDQWAVKDSRIRVIHKKVNNGVSNSRNIGLREAKGEYIGFVDSDDWIDPDMYEQLLYWIKKTGADIAACGIKKVLRRKNVLVVPEEDSGTVVDQEGALLHCIRVIKPDAYIWNKLYRKAVISNEEYNLLFDERITYGEDALWLITVLLKIRKFVIWKGTAYNYLINRVGNTWSSMKIHNSLSFCDSALLANEKGYLMLREAKSAAANNALQRVLYYQGQAIMTARASIAGNKSIEKKYKKGYFTGLIKWCVCNHTLIGLKWTVLQIKECFFSGSSGQR